MGHSRMYLFYRNTIQKGFKHKPTEQLYNIHSAWPNIQIHIEVSTKLYMYKVKSTQTVEYYGRRHLRY